jgi:hypothetical protein
MVFKFLRNIDKRFNKKKHNFLKEDEQFNQLNPVNSMIKQYSFFYFFIFSFILSFYCINK